MFSPIKGVYASLSTPRDGVSSNVDGEALAHSIKAVAATGVDGLLIFGTTGEFIHYDISERMRVLSLALKESPVPVAVNISHSSLAGATELAQHAIEARASAVLLMPPHFFHYSDDHIFAYYGSVAKAINGAVPVYIYNIPFFTSRLSKNLMKRLLATGAYAGIKESSGRKSFFRALRKLKTQVPFQNLAGNERIYAYSRANGADGIISGVAAGVPELIVALDRAIVVRDGTKVRLLNSHLQTLLKTLGRFPAPVASVQAAIARGWRKDAGALPFDERTKVALTEYRRWFDQWLPQVLADSHA
jgi:dihydrodipicolinate synthase/N-acetylneuraminate lyase